MCAVETHGTTQTIYQDGEEVGKVVNNLRIAQILLENGAQPTKQVKKNRNIFKGFYQFEVRKGGGTGRKSFLLSI